MARAVIPALDDLPIVETWSNFRPYTEDHNPVVGATDVGGLWLATGHHRYGILLAPITGQIIADLATGAPPGVDLAPFSVARFRV
jgi:glycine oxidase